MPKLYTIGHSNKPIEEFLRKLTDNKIKILVDARSIPYSRFNPQFNREALRESLQSVGIGYAWRGKNIGGKKENVDWIQTIDYLAKRCAEIEIVVMCSEADPNDCHRKSTIQPDIERLGVEVVHILWN